MKRTRMVTLAAMAGTGLLVSGALAVTWLISTGPAGAATTAAAASLPHGTITTIAGGLGSGGTVRAEHRPVRDNGF